MKNTKFSLAKLSRSILLIVLMILSLMITFPQPTLALIKSQEEAPGQMLYQVRSRLMDDQQHLWQAVLFKRVKDSKVEAIDLRLVGFFESVQFQHPDPLIITNEAGQKWEAADQFRTGGPAPNVGQYDWRSILPKLSSDQSIVLAVPLSDQRTTIKIPAPVILEWQQLI